MDKEYRKFRETKHITFATEREQATECWCVYKDKECFDFKQTKHMPFATERKTETVTERKRQREGE